MKFEWYIMNCGGFDTNLTAAVQNVLIQQSMYNNTYEYRVVDTHISLQGIGWIISSSA